MLKGQWLKGCTDYKKAVQIIKDGGYATSLTYVEKLCSIMEVKAGQGSKAGWGRLKSGIGWISLDFCKKI